MTRQLVLVHGRAQQKKDAAELKKEWLDALRAGLAKTHLSLPIPEADVRFPYYGDTLDDLVSGVPDGEITEVIVKGENADQEEKAFMRAVIRQVFAETGLSEEQIEAEVVAKGPLSWEWLQSLLRLIDRNLPGGSGRAIALATNDVYQYLERSGFRDKIESGIAQAITPTTETVVVAHSLGSVVAYSLLRREGEARGWKVPLFVTVGAPIAVTEIRKRLRPLSHPKCVKAWFNAMDKRDIVALFPLDAAHFAIDPAVENKTDVRNDTPNHHGISGYLSDPVVAQRIHAALV